MSAVLSALILVGCGGGGSSKQTPSEPFELEGIWLYSGAATGYAGRLEFSSTSMTEYDGVGKSTSTWSIDEYDNAQDHVRTTLRSVTGTYPMKVGQVIYSSYVLRGSVIDLYYTGDRYPEASGGTEGVDYWEYTRQSP